MRSQFARPQSGILQSAATLALLLAIPVHVLAAPPGPVKIGSCQTISAPGSYQLTNDLQASANSNCFVITASDVTLDLMGFNILGNGVGSGIHIPGGPLANIEVRNGTIRDFEGDGLHAPNTLNSGFRLIDLRAVSNTGIGIYADGNGHLVRGCTVVENGTVPTVFGNDGMHIGNGATVTGNTAFNNARHGIDAGSGSTVTGNTATGNQRGIATGSGATVSQNSSSNNLVGIDAASNSAVTHNTVWANDSGINANFRNLVKGNTVTANAEGIVTLGDFNVFEENLLVGNTDGPNSGGIVLGSGASDNFCDNNRFADNSSDVVDLSGGNNSACTANTSF